MRNINLFLLLLSSVNLNYARAEQVYGHLETPLFKRGHFKIESSLDRVLTDRNFDVSGKKESIIGKSFETYNLYNGFEWGLSPFKALNGGLLLGHSYSDNGSELIHRNTDLKGVQVGLSQKFKSFFSEKIALDFKFYKNFASNSYNKDQVPLGDGVSWLMVGAWLQPRELEEGRVWAYLGLKHPFKTLSSNIYFTVKGDVDVEKLKVGGGLEGQFVVLKDREDPDFTSRLLFLGKTSAGSFHYYGANSQYLKVQAWVDYNLAPFTALKVGFSKILFGRSISDALEVFIKFRMSLSLSQSGYRFPYLKIKKREKEGAELKTRRIKDYANPQKKLK